MQSWWPRLEEYGPRLACLLLAALIAEESVRAAWSLAGGLADKPPPAIVNRPYRLQASNVDVHALQAMHLFGLAAHQTSDPANAPESTASLSLLGTLATKNPGHGLAIIAAGGAAKVYKVGDDVNGASLHGVYADRVTLERNGNFETVRLPRSQGTTPQGPRRAPAAARGPAGPPPAVSPHLADVIQADPSTDDSSDRLLGFRIRPGHDRAEFFRSGLRPGDLITAVNGTQLADQDRKSGQDAMTTMLGSGSATVSVLRNGKPLDLSVDLEQ
jgi:general secretion pathway protein C